MGWTVNACAANDSMNVEKMIADHGAHMVSLGLLLAFTLRMNKATD